DHRSGRLALAAVAPRAAWPSPARGFGAVLALSLGPGSVSPARQLHPASFLPPRASRQRPSSTFRAFPFARRSGRVGPRFHPDPPVVPLFARGSPPPPAAVVRRSAVARLSPRTLHGAVRLPCEMLPRLPGPSGDPGSDGPAQCPPPASFWQEQSSP